MIPRFMSHMKSSGKFNPVSNITGFSFLFLFGYKTMILESIQKLIEESLNLNELKLVTSNLNKLREYQRYGLSNLKIEKGRDLPEVAGTDIEVILYKALDAGVNCIVEDTSLNVKGYPDFGVNIRWAINNLKSVNPNGVHAEWVVLLGVNDGVNINVYKGSVIGLIKPIENVPENAFGFDPYFFPKGVNKSLYDLEQENQKDKYSARKIAVSNLIKDSSILTKSIEKIPKWTGKYQH